MKLRGLSSKKVSTPRASLEPFPMSPGSEFFIYFTWQRDHLENLLFLRWLNSLKVDPMEVAEIVRWGEIKNVFSLFFSLN